MEHKDERKKSFVLYYATTEQLIDNFDDEEVGKVFRAVARYEMNGILPPDDYFIDNKALRMVFSSIRMEIDRNYEKWQGTCERNKQNRNAYKNRGDEVNRKGIDQSSPVVTSGHQKGRTVTAGTDKEKDKEKDKEQDKEKIGGSATPHDIEMSMLSGDIPVAYGDANTARQIVGMFFNEYRGRTGIEHSNIGSISDFKDKVVDRIFWIEDENGDNVLDFIGDDPESVKEFYRWIIIKYLDRFADDGCSIFHFFSGDIRLMRYRDFINRGDI